MMTRCNWWNTWEERCLITTLLLLLLLDSHIPPLPIPKLNLLLLQLQLSSIPLFFSPLQTPLQNCWQLLPLQIPSSQSFCPTFHSKGFSLLRNPFPCSIIYRSKRGNLNPFTFHSPPKKMPVALYYLKLFYAQLVRILSLEILF